MGLAFQLETTSESNIEDVTTRGLAANYAYRQPASSGQIGGSDNLVFIARSAESNISIASSTVAQSAVEHLANSFENLAALMAGLLTDIPPTFGPDVESLADKVVSDYSSPDDVNTWAKQLAKDFTEAGE